MLRLGPSLNIELLCYVSNQQRREMPSNIDLGAGHIAFFVADIHAAGDWLAEHGAELFPGPIEGAGEAKKDEVIWYFKTPWGAFMEILWRPDYLPYEASTTNRLFSLKYVASQSSGSSPILYSDHVGIVVPELDQAIKFCEGSFGAQLLWRLGPFEKTPTGVPIKSVHLAMLRLGPNLNLELQTIIADRQRRSLPSNIDLGATHVAFLVDDIYAAANSLARKGANLLHGPIATAGDAKAGERIWYFKAPWGSLMEIVSRPKGLPYEQTTAYRLFQTDERWPGKP